MTSRCRQNSLCPRRMKRGIRPKKEKRKRTTRDRLMVKTATEACRIDILLLLREMSVPIKNTVTK